MRNLFLVFMSPLPAAGNRDASLLIYVSKPGFRLKIGMFLHGRAIFGFNDHICFCKCFLHIPFADLVMHADIRIANLFMDAGGASGFIASADHHDRQILIFDFDQLDRRGASASVCCHHNCHLVADISDNIRTLVWWNQLRIKLADPAIANHAR